MVREGTRAAATLFLEATALSRVLEDSSDEEGSEDEWEDPHFLQELLRARYWHRQTVAKLSQWTPDHIFFLDSKRARRELRISVHGFLCILQLLQHHAVFERKLRKQAQAPVQLQLEVSVLLHSYTYHAIAQHFGVGGGSVRKYCDRVVAAIMSLEGRFIKWPDAGEKHNINRVQRRRRFTTFKLKYAPPNDPECYFSRKSDYCFNAQIVCDHRRRVIYYQVGLPGSIHDKRALSFSSMSANLAKYFQPGEYLLGDSAYGVSFPFIVTPYKRPAALERVNASLNFLLAKARIAVEHCIGILKGRFPVLSLYAIHLGEKGDAMRYCDLQRVCFVLHNLCIDLNEINFDIAEEEDSSSESDEETTFGADEFLSSDDLRIIVQHDL